MKKFLSLILAAAISMSLCVPAFAAEADNSTDGAVSPANITSGYFDMETTLSKPDIPNGFYTQPYSVIRSKPYLDVTFEMLSSGLCAYIFSPLGGAAIFVGIIVDGLQALGGSSLPANAVDYVYEAKDPVRDFQVPYVFWHLIEYTVETAEGNAVFYTSYYDYAVMPRGASDASS